MTAIRQSFFAFLTNFVTLFHLLIDILKKVVFAGKDQLFEML